MPLPYYCAYPSRSSLESQYRSSPRLTAEMDFFKDPFFTECDFCWLTTPKHEAIAPVRHQTNQNTCWALCVAEQVSAWNYLQRVSKKLPGDPTEPFILYAAQDLLDCVIEKFPEKEREKDSNGCYGASLNEAYRYVEKYGLCRESENPYIAVKKSCSEQTYIDKAFIKKGFVFGTDDPNCPEEMIHYFLREVPLVGQIDSYASHEAYTITDDIYEGPKSDELPLGDHAVMVLGYGKKDDVKYYLIKNSGGTNWGHGGYGKVRTELVRTLGVVW